MNKRIVVTTWFMMALMILSNIIAIVLLVDAKLSLKPEIKKYVSEEISKIEIKTPSNGINGINGYTPIFGVDYFNGKDGKDSVSTTTTIIEKTIEQVTVNGIDGINGTNGLTPMIRCNTTKNRWEYRYDVNDGWQALNDEIVKCTIDGV